MSPITVSRVLKSLEKRKIVSSLKKANLKQYSLNCQNFETIGILVWIENRRLAEIGHKSLILSLIEELKTVNAEFCILYGSIIKENMNKKSDVDVFFVSDKGNIAEICRKVSILTGKDISPHVVSSGAFRKLLKNRDAFVVNTIMRPENRIFLYGLDKFLKLYA